MFEYVFEGETFNVHPDQKETFLQKYPEAQLVGEGNLNPDEFKNMVNEKAGLVKTTDPVQETASVGSTNTAVNTESPSEDGSLELPGRNNFDPLNPLGLPTDVDPNSPANKKKAADIKKIEDENKKKLDNIKKYETSLVDDAFDNIVNDPNQLQDILGTYDIRSISSKNYGQIPGELTKAIVNSLGIKELKEGKQLIDRGGNRIDIPGNEDEVGEGFSGLTRSQVYRTIKNRFTSLATQKASESKEEDHNTGYKNINLNAENFSHEDFNNSYFDIFNASQSDIQQKYSALNKKLLDKSLTENEINKVKEDIAKLSNYAANEGLQTTVIGYSKAGPITKQVNLLDPDDFFIDTDTGMNVQADLVNSKRKEGADIQDVTELVNDKMSFLGTDRDKLEAGWKNLNYKHHGWKQDGEQLYKVKVNNPTLSNFLRQDGYEPVFNESTKTFEWEVPLSVLSKRGHRIINSTGIGAAIGRDDLFGDYKYKDIELINSPHEDEKELSPREFGNVIYNYHQQGLDYAVDRQAYNKLLWMNKSPESLERTPFYTSINKGLNTGVGMDSRQGKISMTDILPAMDMITAQAGIALSDKQKNAFEKTFDEELFESVGGFAPILLQFWGLNKVQAGVIGATKLGNLFQFAKAGDKIVKTKRGTKIVKFSKDNKAFKADYNKYVKGEKVDGDEILSVKQFTSGDVLRHNAQSAFLNMAVEEVKTQTVGFDTGSGIAFSGMNMLLGPFRFKTAFNQFNSFSNKVVKSGFTFAAAAEGAANFEAAVRHMEGTDDFQDWFKEHNPDGIFGSTARRRMFMNVILGNGLGLTHTTKNDWRSTKTLMRMRQDAFINHNKAVKEFEKTKSEEALKKISENQAIFSEINGYVKRQELLEYHSSAGKMNEYLGKTKEAIKKEFQDKFGKQLDIEVYENNNNKDFDSDAAKGNYQKNKNGAFTIKINRQNNEIGVLPHELGHAAIDALFEGNVAIKQEYLESFNKILTGIKLNDGRTLLDAIKQEKSITKKLTQEEMFTYTAEYLSKPEIRSQVIEQNAISELGQSVKGLFERNFTSIKPPKLRPGNVRDLVNFFGRYARSVNKGKGFTKYQDAFLDILEEAPGPKIKKVKESKELLEAETNVERQILKQRTGKFEGNKILQDNIDLQYNKIAMAALGFKLQKSFDAKAMGLKEAQFNDALSFVTQYKDGIIKRWKPEDGKFSTLVYGNIQPKQALFYEQAFGKGADVTGRITEKTKEIADTSTKTEKAPDLIDPLSFSPKTVKVEGKDISVIEKYEGGLKNVDLSKQDYSTLKDVAPKVTDKIFGETFEAKKEFIKNNAEALYNILPLAFRRMAEGTKSSTKINPGVLKNFYVTGGRASMDVGTRAGLPVKAKIPWANASKKFTEMFTGSKTGNDLRNQKTLIKGLQAEIGKAITNSVARRNPKHPENIIQKLADGKSDVLASKILDLGKEMKKTPISDKIFKIFGGEISQKDLGKIQQSFYNGIRNIEDFALLVLSSNLAPSGSNLKRIAKGKQTFFASNRKGFDKEVELAIKEERVLDLHALVEFKNSFDPTSKAGSKFKEFQEAVKAQNTTKYNSIISKGINEYNKQKASHQKGTQRFLDILSEFYKIDPKAASLIAYNSNANYSAGKNLAQMRGLELATGKKFEIREEHVLQHGQFARLAGEYAKLKNSKNSDPTQVKEMGEWIAENYFQLSLGSKGLKDAGISRTEQTNTHAKVDRSYTINGESVKLQSELHPILEAQVQEALAGKRSWKNVTSPLIRMYNPSIAKGKGGSINMNNIIQDGVPHSVKLDLVVPKRLRNEKAVYEKQAELAFEQFIDPSFKGKQELELFIKERYPKIKEGVKQVEQATKIDAAKGTPKPKESINLDKTFNEYLEMSTGIAAEKIFSDAKGAARGRQVKKSFGDYFVPPGAEDFAGLLHKTLAKGKQGEKQLEFYQKALYEPYNMAMENIAREQVSLSNDFRSLTKQLSTVPKTLKKMTKGGDYTMEQAVRVAVWNKLGYEIPGLTKTDKNELIKEVKNNKELNLFAKELVRITKGDGYAKPKESWIASNIAMDMVSLLNGGKRTKYLETWQSNVNELFNKNNLNKLKAAYGENWVNNLNATLQRMKTGSNRKFGGNATIEKWNDWINGSVGAIMFLNTRSAVLQTISNVNYMNFSDNNPLQAAKAFANQKQYWRDFVDLYNSDYLKVRRGGNQINVNESELALAQKKGGVQGVMALLLNKGFVLTRGADSFAIASGGSAMYRNRLNRYKKEGLSEKEAQEKAFLDFKKITEETQQSSRPDRISEQQAGNLGRFMLAFANTPMQYNRIIKKNAQDLMAGRGNKAEKISRITYYGMVQNLIFNALQKALFVSAFSTEEEENQIKRNTGIANGMMDSILRGSGLTGNAIVGVKNIALDVADRANRPRPNFQDAAWKALTISPPLYSKATKLRGAGYSLKNVTKNNLFEPSLDNPALSAGAQFSSAAFNFPLDRALRKAQNIESAVAEDTEYWQRVALLLGWGEWELGMQDDKKKKKPSNQILSTRVEREKSSTTRIRVKREKRK